MGIEGLGLAWRVAARAGGVPPFIGESLLASFGAALFAVLLVLWLRRSISHPQELRVETHVAITASYLGSIVISTSLLAAAVVPYSRPVAYLLWASATFGGAGLLIVARPLDRARD